MASPSAAALRELCSAARNALESLPSRVIRSEEFISIVETFTDGSWEKKTRQEWVQWSWIPLQFGPSVPGRRLRTHPETMEERRGRSLDLPDRAFRSSGHTFGVERPPEPQKGHLLDRQ